MGRLTLNILLSIAQFQREVAAERTCDKVRASRMKGIFMGGTPHYGYKPKDRKLVIQDVEAQTVLKHGAGSCPLARVPAAEIEAAVIGQIRGMLRAPEVIVAPWRAALTENEGLAEDEVWEAMAALDTLWAELFPAEQAPIVQLLLERVDIGIDGLRLRFRDKGLAQMVMEVGMIAGKGRREAA